MATSSPFLAEACRLIIEFVGDMTLDAYLADRKTRFAVMRGFEMMGEAVRHVPATVKDANPDIPWACSGSRTSTACRA